jgi:hypothetical protein
MIFGKKKNPPSWKKLDNKTKTKVVKTILNLAGPQYKIVNGGFDETQRSPALVEKRNED